MRLALNRTLALAALITLLVVAGTRYTGVGLIGEVLLAWAMLAMWPVLEQGLPRLPGGLTAWAALWLICLGVVALHTEIPYFSWVFFWTLAGLPMAILLWQLQAEPNLVWGWLRGALWLGAAGFATWGVVQIVTGMEVRAHGPLIDPNGYAGAVNLFWFALAARFLSVDARGLPRWTVALMMATFTLLSMAFFGAASRGATLCWLLSVPVLLWVARGAAGVRQRALLLLACGVAGFGLVVLLSANIFVSHTADALSGADGSVHVRLLIWQATVSMIRAHPLLGTGLGTWSEVYARFRPDQEWTTLGLYAHNDYLQLAAEGGLVAVALFVAGLALMAGLLWRLGRTRPTEPDRIEAGGLLVAVMAVSLHAAVNFIFYYAFISILVGVFVGRAWQVYKGKERMVIVPIAGVSLEFRKLLAVVPVLVAVVPMLTHQAASLLNCNHPVVNALERVVPSLNEYNLAQAIHFVSPNEPIPQNIVLKGMEQTIQQAQSFGAPIQRAVLNETLEAYDDIAPVATLRSNKLADEAMLLIKYKDLLPAGEAIARAQKVALESLTLDPRHAESILALAQTQFAVGNRPAGIRILKRALPHLFSVRDQRLLEVVYFRESLAPKRYPELDEFEQELRKFDLYSFDPSDVAARNQLYDRVAARLRELRAENILAFRDAAQ